LKGLVRPCVEWDFSNAYACKCVCVYAIYVYAYVCMYVCYVCVYDFMCVCIYIMTCVFVHNVCQ